MRLILCSSLQQVAFFCGRLLPHGTLLGGLGGLILCGNGLLRLRHNELRVLRGGFVHGPVGFVLACLNFGIRFFDTRGLFVEVRLHGIFAVQVLCQAALADYRLLFGRQLCGQRRVLVLQTGKRAFLLGILCRQAGNGLLQLVQRTLKLRRFGRVAGKMLAHKLLCFQVCSFRGEG